MPADCVFCRIVAGELPADILHREEGLIVIRDIKPAAATHVLVIPERHIQDLRALGGPDRELWWRLTGAATTVAGRLGHDDGYRFYVSVGPGGGQTVPHLHIHVLGGAVTRLPQ
ncbi:MAG TPA: HIT domain-containing protein [Candidatus Micrarchaeia archaeon]|nr:HIT domain-containing protein [Candidatus Micrarchaeia archaeon]